MKTHLEIIELYKNEFKSMVIHRIPFNPKRQEQNEV